MFLSYLNPNHSSAIRHKKNNKINASSINNNCHIIFPHNILIENVKEITMTQLARFFVFLCMVL